MTTKGVLTTGTGLYKMDMAMLGVNIAAMDFAAMELRMLAHMASHYVDFGLVALPDKPMPTSIEYWIQDYSIPKDVFRTSPMVWDSLGCLGLEDKPSCSIRRSEDDVNPFYDELLTDPRCRA